MFNSAPFFTCFNGPKTCTLVSFMRSEARYTAIFNLLIGACFWAHRACSWQNQAIQIATDQNFIDVEWPIDVSISHWKRKGYDLRPLSQGFESLLGAQKHALFPGLKKMHVFFCFFFRSFPFSLFPSLDLFMLQICPFCAHYSCSIAKRMEPEKPFSKILSLMSCIL